MYPSDFGYTVLSGENNENWTSKIQYDIADIYIQNSWLVIEDAVYYEWTISPSYSTRDVSEFASRVARSVSSYGKIDGYSVNIPTSVSVVRPTFSLKPNVWVVDGNGTKKNPYHLSMS